VLMSAAAARTFVESSNAQVLPAYRLVSLRADDTANAAATNDMNARTMNKRLVFMESKTRLLSCSNLVSAPANSFDPRGAKLWNQGQALHRFLSV
jgi:hypothetical protein